MNLLSLTYDQFLELFRQRYGLGDYHAAPLYRAFYQWPDLNILDLPVFAANRSLAVSVEEDLDHGLPAIRDTQDEAGVTKLSLELKDGFCVEAVIIPMDGYITLCISSQVGCRMGCRFCQTGRLGLQRQLGVEEIVAQVYLARVVMGLAVRNVVFMGMGEPLDNWDNVIQAIGVLSDQRGLNIAMRHITLSTIGMISRLQELAALNWPHLGLALSLNAPDDGLRNQLMPATAGHSLEELKRVMQSYPMAKGRVFFIAYVLIRDVNDGEDHARQLAAFLRNLPVKINLIPFNPGAKDDFKAPASEQVEAFRRVLVEAKLFVRLRTSKGAGIRAACGQLVSQKKYCREK